MTMTGDPAKPPGRTSHVPNDGTAQAAAIEHARKEMLHEMRPLHRTRIGADVVCEALLRQGVDLFFSYPGGVILPLYDVLGDYPELRHILVRHEQGGAHAADGYARVTGRVGVCMGTSGPGATNLVTRTSCRASSPRHFTSPGPDDPGPSTSISPRTPSSRRPTPDTRARRRSSRACRAFDPTWSATRAS